MDRKPVSSISPWPFLLFLPPSFFLCSCTGLPTWWAVTYKPVHPFFPRLVLVSVLPQQPKPNQNSTYSPSTKSFILAFACMHIMHPSSLNRLSPSFFLLFSLPSLLFLFHFSSDTLCTFKSSFPLCIYERKTSLWSYFIAHLPAQDIIAVFFKAE